MRIDQLELRHLRSLQALEEAGSVTRAASRVHLTQSALSRQMQQIESLLGCTLFDRHARGLRFTAAGERLLRLAAQVLPAVREAGRDLARLQEGRSGNLRIAVECHSCFDWLMPAMDALRNRWPDVEMDLLSGFQADPLARLRDGSADFAVMGETCEVPDLRCEPLFEFDYLALIARDHPLSTRRWLTAADFAGQTLLSYPVPPEKLDVWQRVLAPAGITPARRTAELTAALLQLVASRRGIAVLPSWAAQPYLERAYIIARPVGEHGLRGHLYGVLPVPLANRSYMQEFITLVRNSAPDDSGLRVVI
jgi:LysR family transcriptional regulator for metE and metH